MTILVSFWTVEEINRRSLAGGDYSQGRPEVDHVGRVQKGWVGNEKRC